MPVAWERMTKLGIVLELLCGPEKWLPMHPSRLFLFPDYGSPVHPAEVDRLSDKEIITNSIRHMQPLQRDNAASFLHLVTIVTQEWHGHVPMYVREKENQPWFFGIRNLDACIAVCIQGYMVWPYISEIRNHLVVL